MTKEEHKEQLKILLGDDDGEKAIRLLENFDKYILRFKTDLNKILEPHKLEVQVGMVVADKKPPLPAENT